MRPSSLRPLVSILLALMLGLAFAGCDPREWFVCSLGYCGYELDDVPPERPRQVVATGGDTSVSLSWRATGEPDLAGYDVFRSTTPGGPYIPFSASGAGYLDTYMVTNGVPYYYVVSARDEAGNKSPLSLEVSATPAPPPPPPPLSAPVLSVERFFDHLHVQWTGVAGAQSYRLFRSTTGGGPYGLLSSTSVGSYFDHDVTGGTQYYYVVGAVDSLGRLGAYSNEVSASAESFSGPSLGYLTTWGERGQQAGRFWVPRGIATDAMANVYVTDNPPEVARVQKFTSSGAFLTSWAVGPSAYGVAVDGSGNVYVVNPLQNRVQKYTAGGVFLTQWGTSGSADGSFQGPTGIAVDGAGGVYVADTGNARVQKFTVTGGFVRKWAVGSGAVGVATDAAGDVYVVDRQGHRVQKFTGDGAGVVEWGELGGGDGQFSAPEGIGVDVSGRVFVADTGNDRIQSFNTGGVQSFAFGSSGSGISQLDAPNAIANDCRANLYVLDGGNSRVKKYGESAVATCPALVPMAAASGALRGSLAAAAPRRPGFRATMATTASTAGVLSTAGGFVRERGSGASGTFTGRVVGRPTRSTRAFSAFSRGTWRARFDITMDPRTSKGTASGVALVTGRSREAGKLCLGFNLKVAAVGKKVTLSGAFETLGGSGRARSLRASGSFTEALGAPNAFVLRGTGAPGRSAGRGLPAACRRLL